MTPHDLAGWPIQLGDVAAWVGSIAAVLALAVPLVVSYLNHRKRAGKSDEQPQAPTDQLSGWSESTRQISDTAVHAVTVTVQNSGDETVYRVRAAVGDSWLGYPIRFTELTPRPELPPKTDYQQTVTRTLAMTADGTYETSPPVELIFRDAAGRHWHRNRNGSLAEITDLPPEGRKIFFADTR
jgi:hypothetical protein